MPLTRPPKVKAQMLIRRPAAEVFQAFVDPAITTKFWFTRGSGRLDAGKTVHWEWEMYGVSAEVHVLKIERDRRLLVEWSCEGGFCPVEWRFTPYPGEATLVVVSNWGFRGDDDRLVDQAIDSAGGFALVLAGAKAWLEHGLALELVGDHAPEARKS